MSPHLQAGRGFLPHAGTLWLVRLRYVSFRDTWSSHMSSVPSPSHREGNPSKLWVSPKLETASGAVSALEIVSFPRPPVLPEALSFPGSPHTPARTHARAHTCCPNGPPPHPAPSLPPTGPVDRGSVSAVPQAPAQRQEDMHTGDEARTLRTDPWAGWGRSGGRWTAGCPDRLTRVGRGRQAAGGGDGCEEDEGARGRHLVDDGKEAEVVAAGEEGGRALSPQPWGPARPWPPPGLGRGAGDAGLGEGGAA